VPFQAEQQPVVEIGQVVDAVAVDQQSVGQAGQFQQPGQVGRGTGQPGDLQPEDRADLAETDLRYQSAESVAALDGAARDTQIGVDDLDTLAVPAQRHGMVDQAVLAGGGFGVLADLRQAGLPDVDHRRSLQVAAADLGLPGHDRPPTPRRPCSPAPPPSRPPAAPGSR
jgi:hypothetical protein